MVSYSFILYGAPLPPKLRIFEDDQDIYVYMTLLYYFSIIFNVIIGKFKVKLLSLCVPAPHLHQMFHAYSSRTAKILI